MRVKCYNNGVEFFPKDSEESRVFFFKNYQNLAPNLFYFGPAFKRRLNFNFMTKVSQETSVYEYFIEEAKIGLMSAAQLVYYQRKHRG